jgi:hypothetical protein
VQTQQRPNQRPLFCGGSFGNAKVLGSRICRNCVTRTGRVPPWLGRSRRSCARFSRDFGSFGALPSVKDETQFRSLSSVSYLPGVTCLLNDRAIVVNSGNGSMGQVSVKIRGTVENQRSKIWVVQARRDRGLYLLWIRVFTLVLNLQILR